MEKRSRKYQGYSMSQHAINLIDYVADKTLVPKSRLVEKAVLEYYANELKELESGDDN